MCWLLVCVICSCIVCRRRRLVLKNRGFEVGYKPQGNGCFCCQFTYTSLFCTYILNIVKTAGRLMDGDDTKMKLENLAVNGSRRAQSRLSIIS